jgi:hypothetical protein
MAIKIQFLMTFVQKSYIVWYGHDKRMDEERLRQKIFNWIPNARRKRGRQKRLKKRVFRAMEECGLRNVD